MSIRRIIDNSSSTTWGIYSKPKDPFEQERFGLITKILRLKKEIRRLRKEENIQDIKR